MAASAAPYGAKPIGTLSASGSFTGKVQHIKIASGYDTLISWGDFVKLVAAGTIEKDAGTTTATPVGVFMGCSYTDPTTSQPTYAQMWTADVAASDAMAYVLTDPNVLFQMQGDGAITQAMLGSNFAIVVTAGSTTIGRSKSAVDQSTSATTNTLPLRIVDYVDGPDSAVGDAYTDVIMKFNVGHQYVNTTGI
jgi:hypothetical protein